MKRTPRSTSRRASRHARPKSSVCGFVEAVQRLASSPVSWRQVDRLGGVLLHLDTPARSWRCGRRGSVLSARRRRVLGVVLVERVEQARAACRRSCPAGGCRSRIGVAGRAEDRRPGRWRACSRSTSSSAPLIGPPVGSSMTTKPGRFSFDAAQAVVDPRAEARAAARGSCRCSSAASPSRGSASRRSSSGGRRCRRRRSPRCGNRSLTHLPHWPYCLNFHFGPTTRPSFFLPPRPKVLTVDRLAVERVQLRACSRTCRCGAARRT